MGKTKPVDLSRPFGDKCPFWPYFEDVKIERVHYHAESGVLPRKIATVMHSTTHADSPDQERRFHRPSGGHCG